MQRSLFAYNLPEYLIAREPTAERSGSRLLCLDGETGEISHQQFPALLDKVQSGDVMVFNNTRVLPARLFGCKPSGGRVEVLVERVLAGNKVLAHVRASRSPVPGSEIWLGEADQKQVVHVMGRQGTLFELLFPAGTSAVDWMQAHGHMPLPPYIDRVDNVSDRERYQTVYAREPGAVAAPTAGLHFDDAMLAALRDKGVDVQFVTLHVGAGTFQPVRTDDIREHVMHSEWLEVTPSVCEAVQRAHSNGKRVIAVGTTSVRCLETAAKEGRLMPFQGETDIFIYPGYTFRVVDALLTNFHLPESTLLMLISAFSGYEKIMSAYREAIDREYRFFSYGDAMWLTRHIPVCEESSE